MQQNDVVIVLTTLPDVQQARQDCMLALVELGNQRQAQHGSEKRIDQPRHRRPLDQPRPQHHPDIGEEKQRKAGNGHQQNEKGRSLHPGGVARIKLGERSRAFAVRECGDH